MKVNGLRWFVLGIALWAFACGRVGADALPDGASGASIDAQVCFGNAPFSLCLASPPTGTLTVSTATTIDTTNSAMCTTIASGGNYCVLAAVTISVEATLRAIGTRPLVLLARESITSTALGVIDVGSHHGETVVGAGAEPRSCDSAAGTPPSTANNTGGGGAGGSFLGRGGTGGAGGGTDGVGTGTVGGAGGQSGDPVVAPSVIELRGGCPGQAGKGPPDLGGIAGRGGGAALLIAGTKLTLAGAVKAGGGGGGGGGDMGQAGGGGGGAGGMIVLDTPMALNTGLLQANGGAGGAGSSIYTDEPGEPGADANAATAAIGGDNVYGRGGNGTAGLVGDTGETGSPGNSNNNTNVRTGGGGGGGGAGLIKAPPTAHLGINVSPSPLP